MRQGRKSVSGDDSKVEPRPKFVNPGAVSYLGTKQGNHTTEDGTFTPNLDPWNAGRGYMAPSIGQKRHKGGSQGSY